METKLKICVFIVLLGIVCAFQTKLKRQGEISLFNIEALANDESDFNGKCMYKGSVDCPISKDKVYRVF